MAEGGSKGNGEPCDKDNKKVPWHIKGSQGVLGARFYEITSSGDSLLI